jgi:hypothetical protein
MKFRPPERQLNCQAAVRFLRGQTGLLHRALDLIRKRSVMSGELGEQVFFGLVGRQLADQFALFGLSSKLLQVHLHVLHLRLSLSEPRI